MNRAVGVILPAVSCLALGWVLGQRQHAEPAARPEGHLAALTRDLALRPEQVEALAQLLAEQDRELQAMVERARAELAEPTADRLQQTEDEMLAMLDPDQQQRYLSLVAAPEAGAGH